MRSWLWPAGSVSLLVSLNLYQQPILPQILW
jgi:hypothetical protein